jgi:hypothetical protein
MKSIWGKFMNWRDNVKISYFRLLFFSFIQDLATLFGSWNSEWTCARKFHSENSGKYLNDNQEDVPFNFEILGYFSGIKSFSNTKIQTMEFLS